MEPKDLVELNGVVHEIIFANEENGYTVLALETDGGETVNVTGCLPYAAPGELLTAYGTWVRHPTHGQQFKAEFAQRHMPVGAQAVYEYLAGRAVTGIGPALASLIVSEFGEKALDVIAREPEKLAKIKGIGPKRAKEMSQSLRRQLSLRRLIEFLSGHSVQPHYAMRLYRVYGDRAMELLEDNPYILCAQPVGGLFSDADRLALDMGMEGDSAQRIAAAILFELQHNSGNGHVFIPREKLIPATAQLLEIDTEPVEEGLEVLLDSGEVVCETVAGREACYLEKLHEAESGIARRLLMLRDTPVGTAAGLEDILARLEREQGITYAPLQRKTLEIAAGNNVTVITGGPGTGKTTTVRAIIAMFQQMGLDVVLAAPTGRAAKRMTELTGREAQTIHRLLEAGYDQASFAPVFKRDRENRLKCDAVIVDECSMIDVPLMYALLQALPEPCRLVLVGDADQLPPVGPGCVFLDILRACALPVVRLTEIFRQTADSRIIRYAHQINAGEHPDIGENKGDFFFLRRLNQEAARDLIVQLCAQRLPENMGIPAEEIQVLTPMRRGTVGVEGLNRALQNALNPPAQDKPEKKFGEIVFRVGDRVMQIRNNYDILWVTADQAKAGTGVFNGDIGYILSVDLNNELLIVDYDGRLTSYGFDMLDELEHAWAMTVHKSQGSEYRAVILCAVGGPQQLLYRGVLYTAVTRARELLIAVGDEHVIGQMIDNHKQARRYSGLRARLAGEIA